MPNNTVPSPAIDSANAWDVALQFVLAVEGLLADDPDDPGGRTMRGVTQKVYDEYRESEDLDPRDVRLIAMDEVRAIYQRDYWRPAGCQILVRIGQPRLALLAFDWAVNAGVGRARRYVQAVVNTTPDGEWGPKTLDALVTMRGDAEVTRCAAFQRLRAHHYRLRAGEEASRQVLLGARLPASTLPMPHPPSRKFLKGWLARLRRGSVLTGTAIAPEFAKSTT